MTDAIDVMIQILEEKYTKEKVDIEIWRALKRNMIGNPKKRHIIENRIKRGIQ